MAGDDSPTEKREEFNFGRSTPPPTTSYIASKQDYSDIKTVAEPPKEEKEKDKDKDKEKEKEDKDVMDMSRPDANPGYDPNEIRSKGEQEDSKRRDKREDKDWNEEKDGPGKKIDGSDRLDGQWIPAKDSKPYQDDEEDDDCAVKCLYYTMQCCECSIS